MDNFVVGLTNKNPTIKTPVYMTSYTLCAQYNGSVADHEDAVVVCEPTNQTFRYVIVHGSNVPDRSLCLAEVSVYDRGKWQSLFNTTTVLYVVSYLCLQCIRL